MTQNSFTSKRSITAIQRINAIHTMYSNQITNQDMKYVLMLFVLEPINWINKHEWRQLTQEECYAMLLTWKYIGKEMGIQDIPDSLEEWKQWVEEYEKQYMIYSKSNVVIGNATMLLFLSLAPKFMHSFGRQVSYTLMDVRLRKAMGFPNPLPIMVKTIHSLLKIRKYFIRYFCLPRLISKRRTPWESTNTNNILCPRFHVYEKTYPNGYITNQLGSAPKGKVMTTCPKWQ